MAHATIVYIFPLKGKKSTAQLNNVLHKNNDDRSKHVPSQLLKYNAILYCMVMRMWEGLGDVGSARYEPVQLPPTPTTDGVKLGIVTERKG